MARKCQYCENPSCAAVQAFNIRGLLRRVSVGNFVGAKKITDEFFKKNENPTALLLEYESKCIVEDLKIGEVADYFNAPSFDDAV